MHSLPTLESVGRTGLVGQKFSPTRRQRRSQLTDAPEPALEQHVTSSDEQHGQASGPQATEH